jgi:hypothetical protein
MKNIIIIIMHDMKELHETAILGTAHTLREVLMCRCGTFSMGANIRCAMNCAHRIAATLCTLETWLVSGV